MVLENQRIRESEKWCWKRHQKPLISELLTMQAKLWTVLPLSQVQGKALSIHELIQSFLRLVPISDEGNRGREK